MSNSVGPASANSGDWAKLTEIAEAAACGSGRSCAPKSRVMTKGVPVVVSLDDETGWGGDKNASTRCTAPADRSSGDASVTTSDFCESVQKLSKPASPLTRSCTL